MQEELNFSPTEFKIKQELVKMSEIAEAFSSGEKQKTETTKGRKILKRVHFTRPTLHCKTILFETTLTDRTMQIKLDLKVALKKMCSDIKMEDKFFSLKQGDLYFPKKAIILA